MRVETNSLGTSVADKASYLSRFFYKLLEIMGAAVATAVSGYFVAHLGGFLPSQTHTPAPPAVAVAPSERPVPKTVPVNAPPSQPAAPQATQSAAASESGEQRTAQPQPDTTGSAVQSARKTANGNAKATPAPAPTQATAPARKRGNGKSDKAETAATDANKPREATEAKPRDGEDEASVEARVRAALANVDANRPAPADVPPRRGDGQGAGQPGPAEGSPGTTAAIPPRPVEQPPASVGAGGQPRSADLGTPMQQPAIPSAATQSPTAQPTPPAPLQVAPVQPAQQPDALTTVEIKSRPVANIEAMPAAEPAPPPQEERGVLSAIKHILPDFRRPASADEAPRPPAAVGE